MARRVEIEPTVEPVRIPVRILNELFEDALKCFPEECCGLVLGRQGERYRRVVRCRNEMTARHQRDPIAYPRDGRAAFYMNEHDYQKAQAEAEAAGDDVTAVYHSHVGHGAYLSDMDLTYAENPFFPFPRADQIVLEVSEDKVREAAVFRRCDGRFVGHRVEQVDP